VSAVPLGRGIVEVFEAIPERIEVSGHGPTWRVTGGSFDAVLDYTREAFGEAVVVAREDRRRWWPRVTLTVTRDPALAAEAPPLEAFADAPEQPDEIRETEQPDEPEPVPDVSLFDSALEEIFAHQEELRMARGRIPEQRSHRA
jgi:hypothetical protein